jgi:hypothetical protein
MRTTVLAAFLFITFFPLGAALAAGAGEYSGGAPSDEHFHPKGKPPSEHTLKVLAQSRKALPFSDERDFEEEKKGFMAAPEFWQIKGDAGNIVWDMERYKFFLEGVDFPSIHPSLQRQSTLNMNYGLYEVIPGFYQVRGFDLANITFVKGKTGWIVFDPLTAPETAARRSWSTSISASDPSLRSSTPTPTSITGVVCAASSRKPTCGRARFRSSPRVPSCSSPCPRTYTLAMP